MNHRLKLLATLSIVTCLPALTPNAAFGDGACCMDDGTCATAMDANDCINTLNGFYWGDGTACGVGGACTGACSETGFLSFGSYCVDGVTPDECASLTNKFGFFAGYDTTCGDLEQPYIHEATLDGQTGGGEINISGASLFVDYFRKPAGTNDFINVDNDFIACSGEPFALFADTNCDTFADAVDQLAPNWSNSSFYGQWLVQYRSVGSGNGLAEFVDYQLLGLLPTQIPSEAGITNRLEWANTGYLTGAAIPSDCFPTTGDLNCDAYIDGQDVQAMITAILDPAAYSTTYPDCEILNGDFNEDSVVNEEDIGDFISAALNGGLVGEPGSPYCPTSIDIAVMDVATKWFVKTDKPANAQWNRKPTADGYGDNPHKTPQGQSNSLKSLKRSPLELNTNTEVGSDANTVFDTTVAYSAVAIIANRGTGLESISYSDMQYAWVTGRLPNGENIVLATRDSGSGTRNAAMNAIGVDPSWGVGDNYGVKIADAAYTNLGPNSQPDNCGGSSIIENAVQNWRLCVGYTGLFGSSRAGGDALGGKYEVLNVIKDIQGGTLPVRPTVDTVLDNADVNTGYQLGGSQTFATRGDPKAALTGKPAMANTAARDYLLNLLASIDSYVDDPNAPEDANMPAQILVVDFVLDRGVDAIQNPLDPTSFIDQTGDAAWNQALQDAIRANNTTIVPDWGVINDAGKVPVRVELEDPNTYSDGGTGDYRDRNGNYTILGGTTLMARMSVQGDFNADGERNMLDIKPMMLAYQNPLLFSQNDAAGVVPPNGSTGGSDFDYIVPEILGDFNGDGNFDAEDIRYFADGLAIDPMSGELDRKTGFETVDNEWFLLTGDNNFFGTTVPAPHTYAVGDSRLDVAGGTISRGFAPTGADGVIDAADKQYVVDNAYSTKWGSKQNVGGNLVNAWLGEHALKDLSCDMNGDLIVDATDVTPFTTLGL